MPQPAAYSRIALSLLDRGRVAFLLASVGNIWLITFLSAMLEPQGFRNPAIAALGLPLALLLAAVVAVGLSICGMALNDVLDVYHDRTFAPQRPLPRGIFSRRTAITLAMGCLLLAIAAAVPFGKISVWLTLLAAGGVLFYNLTGRFVPAVGIVTLGLLSGLTMIIVNPMLSFAWPVLLVMTHVMAVATLRHWLADKRPALARVDGWGICLGWMFWTLLALAIMTVRTRDNHALAAGVIDQAPLIWLGPAIALALFIIIAWRLIARGQRHREAQRHIAEQLTALAGLWMLLYALGWLLFANLWPAAAICACLLLVNLLLRWIAADVKQVMKDE